MIIEGNGYLVLRIIFGLRIIKSRRMRWEWHVARTANKLMQYWCRKTWREDIAWIYRRRQADNVKINLQRIGYEGMDWVHLGHDGVQARVVGNTATVWIPYRWSNAMEFVRRYHNMSCCSMGYSDLMTGGAALFWNWKQRKMRTIAFTDVSFWSISKCDLCSYHETLKIIKYSYRRLYWNCLCTNAYQLRWTELTDRNVEKAWEHSGLFCIPQIPKNATWEAMFVPLSMRFISETSERISFKFGIRINNKTCCTNLASVLTGPIYIQLYMKYKLDLIDVWKRPSYLTKYMSL
jgi:hypothetical protein